MLHCDLSDVNICDYTLKYFDVSQMPEGYLEVVFRNEDTPSAEESCGSQKSGQEGIENVILPFPKSETRSVRILNARLLVPGTSNHKKVMEFTLDTKTFENCDFLPGDCVGILPSNSDENITEVLESMHLLDRAHHACDIKLKKECVLKHSRATPYNPTPTTPWKLLHDCLNLHAVPKKTFLRALAQYCDAPDEKRFLCSLSSRQGSHIYSTLVIKKRCTFLDLLRLCPSCCPPLELLLEQLPRLMPRPYSIASSPLSSPESIKIIFSVIPNRRAVCTRMLNEKFTQMKNDSSQTVHQHINMYFRARTQFYYPAEEVYTNYILIGVGTGLAPFLGFLEHKALMRERGAENYDDGEMWLFSGNRTPQSAFCRQKFQEYEARGILTRYFEAFSLQRQWPFAHVQDLIKPNCDAFVELLMKPTTCMYVCADGAIISASIEKFIKRCLERSLPIDYSQADELIRVFRQDGKYREELWS